MTIDVKSFQALLEKMRDEFLGELPEKCDRLDDLILMLEKTPENQNIYNELFRSVHSMKGSGGTHGLSILTSICHQLETHLSETEAKKDSGINFPTRALAYVDLMRRVNADSTQGSQAYSAIDAELEGLRQSGLQRRKAVLIVESSRLMAGIYQQALDGLPLQISVESNGLIALARLLHEPFALAIVGRELEELNGISIVAALRYSELGQSNIPVILVSSKRIRVPEEVKFSANISRDKNLAENLLAAVKAAIPE